MASKLTYKILIEITDNKLNNLKKQKNGINRLTKKFN